MNDNGSRDDDVLAAFAQACPLPTPQQVSDWSRAHPAQAAAIRELAADMLAARLAGGPAVRAGAADVDADAIDAEELEAAFAEVAALSGLYAGPGMPTLVDGAGIELPDLARRLGIGVDVLVALEEGTMSDAPPRGFVTALASAVRATPQAVLAAIEASRREPLMAEAAALDASAEITPRTWRELVESSPMPDGRKAFWLAAD